MGRAVLIAICLSCVALASWAAPPDLGQRLEMIAAAYPEAIADVSAQELVMVDGARWPLDDAIAKPHAHSLARADIEDTLAQIYPLGACDLGGPPARNVDPGRIRHDGLLKALYGASPDAVAQSLVEVPWFGTAVRFSGRHGAAAALARVAQNLTPATPDELRFLRRLGGTVNWRVIAGTSRLSAHSYGIAIDLNPKLSAYWRWAGGTPGQVPRHHTQMPRRIVEAFEREGFIWGGKWYHFDTMHFEYRPELILIGRLAEAMGCQ